MGDPSIDLSVFTNPENPGRTMLVLDVFPSAGTSAMYSNVVDHAFAVAGHLHPLVRPERLPLSLRHVMTRWVGNTSLRQ
jgi:hypothetical protein